ncbi:hypothetical protein GobsT_11190 [Gemmata obscuriglobus]|nr:YfbM family protein [Gemmata obscuriglobus]QEG26380.1 hypothetical protein GobsT_11190 [Gemmata obscuriglobus]VTS01430.1 Uncharacterized protein OS=Clostridium clariflavum (strain DSM 19732 / NBRC 101661 / EBR45) GN=Clocl_2102 PE=4 SV=1: DUF1877 [Gemmata obscuriglobus UQM 2246]
MGVRGVHLALTAEESSRLMDTPYMTDDAIIAFVEEIEARWDREWLQETDKAWDAIHRCLTGGKLEYGDSPLHMCVFAHDNLLVDEDRFTVCHADANEVKQVAAAIAGIDKAELRRRYDAIEPDQYDGALGDEDFEYTWGWFVPLREFFNKAAAHDRAVIFTV